MRLIGCDVAAIPDPVSNELGLQLATLDEVLGAADFLSLNCNLTAENRHLLGKREFERMKPGIFLINTARGRLIDEDALADALGVGTVAGAALDVFEEEPLPAESPLRGFQSCIFGSHNASNTAEAVARVNATAIEILVRELAKPGDRDA